MSIEKSIGWTDMTINPIKGKCQGGCWYCWTKPLYKRKFLQPELNLNLDVFFRLPKKSKRTFLCSTHDLFGSWVPSWWRTAIFERIEANSQHTFQLLTKFPQNIDRPMPDNVWLGVSVTGIIDYPRFSTLKRAKAKVKFISFEPLLERDEIPLPLNLSRFIDWIIVGRLTGYGHDYDPRKKQLIKFKRFGNRFNIPIFLKNNLKSIWGENLIQEFPE